MNEISSVEITSKALAQLSKGAFLNTKKDEEINVMTISWGMIGIVWRKNILQVLVRKSRHSYSMIDEGKVFTVSLPMSGQLEEALTYCGKHSGRNINKFEACGLTPKKGQSVDCHIIKECDLHFECKVVGKQFLNDQDLFEGLEDVFYKNNDYHTMFYGEIVNCYTLD